MTFISLQSKIKTLKENDPDCQDHFLTVSWSVFEISLSRFLALVKNNLNIKNKIL